MVAAGGAIIFDETLHAFPITITRYVMQVYTSLYISDTTATILYKENYAL